MIAVRVVQVAVDEIIDVVAMRHGFVAAAGAMDMTRLMPRATMTGRAAVRVLLADLDHMLVDMVAMRMMEVAVMQVIDMIAVAHRGVAAAGAVLVIVVVVMGKRAAGRCSFLSVQCASQACATAFSTRLSTWASAIE